MVALHLPPLRRTAMSWDGHRPQHPETTVAGCACGWRGVTTKPHLRGNAWTAHLCDVAEGSGRS